MDFKISMKVLKGHLKNILLEIPISLAYLMCSITKKHNMLSISFFIIILLRLIDNIALILNR